jgi:glycosyltransferase involved in cell wall biosynthesis
MKILLLTEFFPHLRNPSFAGGVEARSYFLAKNLVKRHKIIVIARRQNKIPDKETVKSLLVIRCGLKTSSPEATLLSFFSRLTFFLQSIFIGLRQDFDIIEGSNFVTFIPTFIIAQIKKKPSVIWYPDVLIEEWTKYFGIILGLIGEFTERVSLKLPFKKIIALSNQTQKKLIKQKINFKKIIVIYGGYDPKEFRGKPPKKFPLFTICTISRLVPYKKIDVLIKAFKLVKEKISDANLIIIGQGQQEKKLRRIVQSEKISDSVGFFKGDNRKKTLSILKKSHLFCLPSVIEGFGFVTIEAMAAGLPVILTDISINREITQQGKGVLFFKPNNEKDLSQKILTILQNKQLATKLRKEQIKFKSLYTWYRMTAETEKIYLSLLKQ